MKSGDIVRLTKIGTAPGGRIACPMGLYSNGAWTGVLALPIGTVMEGRLVLSPAPNHFLELQVVLSQGKRVRQRFRSRIRWIAGGKITTVDSIYRVEVMNRAEDFSWSWAC